ncbi:MAG: hypothetical protein RLZ96_349 [Actinomycetota bacterium]
MKFNWIVAALLPTVLLGPTAVAHDELVGTSPAAGSVVEAGQLPIELEFSNELLDLGSGAEIVITDPSSKLVPSQCATIDGTFARTLIDVDLAGEYQVAWRAVSGDGHPIEGSFSFQVTNTSGYQASGVAEPCLISAAAEEPAQFNYWLLFGSLTLVAIGLFFYLRPRKK